MAADAESVTGRIAQAIEAVIRGAGLSPAPASIVRRKKLVVLDGDVLVDGDKKGIVIIAVSDDELYECLGVGAAIGRLNWLGTRNCTVGLGYSSQSKTGNNEDLRKNKGKIEDAVTMQGLQAAGLRTPKATANDVTPGGRAVFDPASTAAVDWSVATFKIETLEDKPA